jgi:hypothetical protein
VIAFDSSEESPDKWTELPGLAAVRTDNSVSAKPIQRVVDAKALLEEAIWNLCEAPCAGSPQLSVPAAKRILQRLEAQVVARINLASDVEVELSRLFPDQPAEDLAGSLRDWLDRRATSSDEGQRRFGVVDIVLQIAGKQALARLQPETWACWLTAQSEWGFVVRGKSSQRLGASGEKVSIEQSHPELIRILDESSSTLLLGGGGLGKTTLLALLAETLGSDRASWLVPAANLIRTPILLDLFWRTFVDDVESPKSNI